MQGQRAAERGLHRLGVEAAPAGGHMLVGPDQIDGAGLGVVALSQQALLQAETCVQWSRFASFVEVGGRVGLGYRDTAQDVMSVIHSNPTKTRSRIMELLRAQTEAGYGLHLFDPKAFDPDAEKLPDVPSPTIVPTPSGSSLIHGLEDTSSDSHLWLVPSGVEFVKETGDLAFLDLEVPFAEGTPGTVYDHLKAALDFSAKYVGQNGVAQGLRADWNDCLNLGGGERLDDGVGGGDGDGQRVAELHAVDERVGFTWTGDVFVETAIWTDLQAERYVEVEVLRTGGVRRVTGGELLSLNPHLSALN
jgi:hypothetical protein